MTQATQPQYDAETKLQRAFVYLMRHPDFVAYASVILVGDTRIEDDPAKMPTAATDGYNCIYSRQFLDRLTEPETRAVVLHENLHKALMQLRTWRYLFEQNAMLTNAAADFVVNDIIVQADNGTGQVVLPQGGLHDAKYRGWNVAEVYNDLAQNGMPQGAGGSGQCSGNCQGAQASQQGQPGEVCTCPVGFDEHDWQKANGMTPEQAREAAEQIDSALRQGAVLAGKAGGNVDRMIGELLEVKIDYREILSEFLHDQVRGGDESSWRRPNRRMLQQDIYIPSTITEAIDEVVIAVDTSGSIYGDVLTEFVSNVAAILERVNPKRSHLLYWDSEVAGHETYEGADVENMKANTQPRGGGGTSPSCITAYLRDKEIEPTCVVVLTDGYVGSDWGGDWPCPVLWVIKDNDSAMPAVGKVARL